MKMIGWKSLSNGCEGEEISVCFVQKLITKTRLTQIQCWGFSANQSLHGTSRYRRFWLSNRGRGCCFRVDISLSFFNLFLRSSRKSHEFCLGAASVILRLEIIEVSMIGKHLFLYQNESGNYHGKLSLLQVFWKYCWAKASVWHTIFWSFARRQGSILLFLNGYLVW